VIVQANLFLALRQGDLSYAPAVIAMPVPETVNAIRTELLLLLDFPGDTEAIPFVKVMLAKELS
jgi:hypothetical protein